MCSKLFVLQGYYVILLTVKKGECIMKILHTADWHIGCRTDDFLRIEEQKEVCQQIVDIANKQKVDMVVIAGDLYDSFLPSAESEKLVFDTLIKLSDNGNRPVIAIAGNHDEPKRFANANVFASLHNIYLVGEMGEIHYADLKGKNVVPVDSGVGYIEFKSKAGEKVVVATMPYPSYYRYKQIKKDGEQLKDSIKEWFKPALSGFRKDTINIAVSHLLTYPINCTPEEFSNYEVVGGAISFVDRENLVSKAHYTALGHIHQFITVDKQNHIYYSGSTVNKFFDDISVENYVVVADISKKGVNSVEKFSIDAKHLISQRVSSVEEAMSFLNANTNKIVRLIFEDMDFVNPQDIKDIRSKFKNVITISVEPKRISDQVVITKKDLSTKEVFEKFVENKTGAKPEDELTKLFMELMGEVVYEA